MKSLRRAEIAAVVLSVFVLVAHAWVSLTSGHDVNLVSGVWLALARDLRDGVFYRDLLGPQGYGGTRYFPLFFGLIAACMGLGLEPVMAGQAASLAGGSVLVTGAFALSRQLGLPRNAAIPIVVLATTAPYFTQQSLYAIRVEPLAAGLALWGLAAVSGAVRHREGSWRTMAVAAVWFTLAVAAKPTSLYAPLAALLTLVFARRWSDASRLSFLTLLGVLLLVAGVDWLSDGRFLLSLQATALAGETPAGLLTTTLVVRPIALIGSSRMLSVVFLLAAAALITSRTQWKELPVLAVVIAAAATAVILATPGTILTNQIVELYVVTVLFLGWFCNRRNGMARWGTGVLTILLTWTASQNAVRLAQISRQADAGRLRAHRPALVAAVRDCGGPVLAESPLVAILAGQSPLLLDPFAFRIVAARIPTVADDLTARLAARQFACVVLEQDPEDQRGAGWYRNVHLGWPVVEAVRRHYQYRASVGGHRFYTALP